MGDSATPVLLVTAGGLAREVLAAMRSFGGWDVVGMLDHDPNVHGRDIDGVQVLGSFEEARRYPDCRLLVCHESPAVRQQSVGLLAECGATPERYASFVGIHRPLPDGMTVGKGSLILAETALTAGVTIAEHVVVMPRASLAHDVVLSAFATVGAGAAVAGRVHVGHGAWLQMCCSVAPGVAIGPDAQVGMGSAVLGDVPAAESWAGVPARPVAESGDQQTAVQPSYLGDPQRAAPSHTVRDKAGRSAFERLAAAADLVNAP
jgi:sugar O-acyltransferase (sialic acid O-acetyltransferase NeuD family)